MKCKHVVLNFIMIRFWWDAHRNSIIIKHTKQKRKLNDFIMELCESEKKEGIGIGIDSHRIVNTIGAMIKNIGLLERINWSV